MKTIKLSEFQPCDECGRGVDPTLVELDAVLQTLPVMGNYGSPVTFERRGYTKSESGRYAVHLGVSYTPEVVRDEYGSYCLIFRQEPK